MENFFLSIKGFYFFVYYIPYIIFWYFFFKIIVKLVFRKDPNLYNYLLNKMSEYEYHIAYLIGGIETITEAIMAYFYSLGLIRVHEKEKDKITKINNQKKYSELDSFHRELYDFLPEEIEKKDIDRLKQKLEQYYAGLNMLLVNSGIFKSKRTKDTLLLKIIFSFLILAPGLYRLYLGISHGKSILFLLIFMIIISFVIIPSYKVYQSKIIRY